MWFDLLSRQREPRRRPWTLDYAARRGPAWRGIVVLRSCAVALASAGTAAGIGAGIQDLTPALTPDTRDATGEGIAFVELSTPSAGYFRQQPFVVTLRFGLEQGFARDWAVPPFPASLDVPVQLIAPWLNGLNGARALGLVGSASLDPNAGGTFALGERIERARSRPDEVIEGKRFRVYSIDAQFLPTSSGPLRFSAPRLNFAHATRYEESLFGSRVPMDRLNAFVTGEPHTVTIAELPEAGRPPEFAGAIGRFEVRSRLATRTFGVDEGVKLELTVTGDGNLFWFDPPRWAAIGPFHVRGILDRVGAGARILTLDLAPRSAEVRQVPSVVFPFFDPTPPGAYRFASTEPIDVVVQAARTAELSSGTAPAADGAGDRQRAPWRRIPLGLVTAALVAWLVWRARPRRD